NQRALVANQRVVTCFECGVQGHYKKGFPKLKNNNRGTQAGNDGAIARAYAVGNAGKNPDVVTPPNGAKSETRVRRRDVIIHITQDTKNDL
ncbi:hypothetical protein Tco_0230552, partial [Tanacetum coccineum]